jgi:hypothetical protein
VSYRKLSIALLAAALLAPFPAALGAGEFKSHGFTLPGGAVKVDDDRYRLSQAWDDAKRFFKSVYPPAKFPRRTLPNFSGVRAEHIANPGGGEWDGVNIYENRGEVRVFILARKAPAKGKEIEEGEAPEE